mgnify:CR=1 FL=1
MNIVHASRSEFKTYEAVEDEEGRSRPAPPQTAHYRIVICHDALCPGQAVDGHQLVGPLRQSHHEFVFLDDARTEDEVLDDIEAIEAAEATERVEKRAPRTDKNAVQIVDAVTKLPVRR